MADSKERFSNRVDKYVQYRPGYPEAAIDYLYGEVGFRPDSDIADIGAGTGIFSGLLVERGSRVVAVEPNAAMRRAAEEALGGEPGFRAWDGSAEATGLPDASVDFIACAQAFHWFDRSAAHSEFRRILKPGGRAALVWNVRLLEGVPFLEAYERLLQTYGTDYAKVRHHHVSNESELAPFFKDGAIRVGRFANAQLFGFDGLRGRLESSSYCPLPGDARYEELMAELRRLFDAYQENGTVAFEYETKVYWGEL